MSDLEKIEEIVPSDKTYNKYIDRYEKYKHAHSGYAHYLSYELNAVEKQNEILREAVEFYASEDNLTPDGSSFYRSGKRARETLSKLKDLE